MLPLAPARDVPPPLELLCLQALWGLGEGNVADVRQSLAETKSLAYTTVMTILDRLEKKGFVNRHKAGRAYNYVPLVTREAIQQQALSDFVRMHFNGSRSQLMEFLTRPPEAPPVVLVVEEMSGNDLDASLL